MTHIIYTINDKVKSVYKDWDFWHAEEVLTRAGVEYWEIGISETEVELVKEILSK